jgi:hypothetical protein
MRFELWIFFITFAILYDTYHNHIYSKKLMQYKKYAKIIGISIIVFFFYLFVKKNPENTHNILDNLNNCIKYLPLDKNTSSLISTGTNFINQRTFSQPFANIDNTPQQPQQFKTDETKTTKRSVSETKKKYVAYLQGWKCDVCKRGLDHTYEIDHKIELRNGGSNETDNLVALCASCHRLKTASNYL